MIFFISLSLTLFCIISFPYWVPQSSQWLTVPQVKYDYLIPDTGYCSVLLSTIYTAFVYLIVRICTYVCTVCNTSCDKVCHLKPPLE